MTPQTFTFSVRSRWAGGADGMGLVASPGGVRTEYSMPADLGGQAARSNPGELLAASLASCYSMTLALLLERRRIPFLKITVGGEVDVAQTAGGRLRVTGVRLHPHVLLAEGMRCHRADTLDAAYSAERDCVIARALDPDIPVSIDPECTCASGLPGQSDSRGTALFRVA